MAKSKTALEEEELAIEEAEKQLIDLLANADTTVPVVRGLLRPRFRLAIGILADGMLLGIWFLAAWGLSTLANCIKQHGVNEIFADIFKWVSSVTTLLLAVLYVLTDILKEIKNFYRVIKEFRK